MQSYSPCLDSNDTMTAAAAFISAAMAIAMATAKDGLLQYHPASSLDAAAPVEAYHMRKVGRPVAELDAQGGQNRHDGGVMAAVDVEGCCTGALRH